MSQYGKMDFKPVHCGKVVGRRIYYAYDLAENWERYLVGVSAPDPSRLFNFDLYLGKLGGLTILDNYGDEQLPDKIRRKILNTKMHATTIGIFRKTGEVVQVSFIKEKAKTPECPEESQPESLDSRYSVLFWSFDKPHFLPKPYMYRVDELKSKKRPFYLTCSERSIYDFVTRWGSYADLQANLVIDFHFDKMRLQVWSGSYREVSGWQNNYNQNEHNA